MLNVLLLFLLTEGGGDQRVELHQGVVVVMYQPAGFVKNHAGLVSNPAAGPVRQIGAVGIATAGEIQPGVTELLRQIKPTGTPVIFITAKGSVQDRVQGLRAGADDYLVKPFEIVELIARVESVLRRAGKASSVYTLGDVTVDTESMLVTKAGAAVTLTRKEFDLLVLFMQNQNVALFRETIYERVWESDYMGDTRTVDLHVQRLRKKLDWQHRLCAIHKVGYRLEGDG